MAWVNDTIKIRGKDIPVRIGYIEQHNLKFFVDNPRIYSVVRAGNQIPDQEEIEKQLLNMDHVKELLQDIKANGGLIDPVIVRDGTFEVLEGNRRLAAYRGLAKKDPIKWGKIKCHMLPESIEDSDIFALLGQYHIKGKKDWAPYEQAGFLYRRNKQHGISVTELGEELSIGRNKASQLIKTYQFMIDHNDTETTHWSYYEEFIKSNKIKKLRAAYEGVDEFISLQIKSGKIEKAVDIRDKLPVVASSSKKIIKKFLCGDIDLNEAYARAHDSGDADEVFQKLKRFKFWILDPEIQASILASSGPARDKMKYEINKINSQCNTLMRKLKK